VKWKDGLPLVAKRAIGRGEAWIVTLPFSVDASDLTLRPGFLALLDDWVAHARARAAPRRGTVGVAWTFPGATKVEADGPSGSGGRITASREGAGAAGARIVPPLAGAYHLDVDGKKELRVASPPGAEIDFRARHAAKSAAGPGVGDKGAAVDISSQIALSLLVLLTLEMALRALSARRTE
jgi:hypothetical protein